ncbi:MAG: AsmA-like C-terminal region-containing protein [Burkholderiales bacterium]
MKWFKRLLIAFGILLLVLIAVPFFIPLDTYIPEIEKLASEQLHEPVRIESVHAWFLPLPHATVTGITVGRGKDIEVGKVSVVPDIISLFEPVKVVKLVEIEELKLRQNVFDKIPVWIKLNSGGAAAPEVKIEQIRLRNLVLVLKNQTLGPFDLDASVANNNIESATLSGYEDKLRVTIKPLKNYYLLDIQARKWPPPLAQLPQPVLIDELSARGRATLQEVNFPQVSIKLYGGSISGKITASWKNDWKTSGEFQVKDMEVGTLAQMFSKTSVSGKLTADAKLSASGKTAQQLIDNPSAEAVFSIADGVLHNMDLTSAATSFISKDGVHGGETKFDQLTGKVYYADKKARLRDIKVMSGSLGAEGYVDISPAQELSGTVNAKVKKGISLVSMPLTVFGTLSDPLLRPTAGAMAGAAAGTVLLGPVLGTSIGIKAGEFTQNLFGKKPDQDEEKKPPEEKPKPEPSVSSPAPFLSSPSK